MVYFYHIDVTYVFCITLPFLSSEAVCILCAESPTYKDLHPEKPIAVKVLEDYKLFSV